MSTYRTLEIVSKVHDYSVFFTDDFTGFLAEPDAAEFYLVDANVARLYAEQLAPVFARPHLVIEATEANKSIEGCTRAMYQLVEGGFKRGMRLVAIGGGIVQDICCFCATVIYRGVEWRFYPTTLLAQADSCIGSKSSVNMGEYKNLVGSFYPPNDIVLDTAFLTTLAQGDILSGLGEIIKVHLLDSPESMEYVRERYAAARADVRSDAMAELIVSALSIKKRVIEIDEYDRDYRNIMNYGHTFGHAIESLTDYGMPHGQAITIGMDLANDLSWFLGMIDEATYRRMREAIVPNWPSMSLAGLDLEKLFDALKKDKKNTDERVAFILTRGPGQMSRERVALDDAVRGRIAAWFEAYRPAE